MAEVDRIFLVNFDQQSLLVEYLLPKSNCILLLVDQFQISGCPIHFAFDIEPVKLFPSSRDRQLPNFLSFCDLVLIGGLCPMSVRIFIYLAMPRLCCSEQDRLQPVK